MAATISFTIINGLPTYKYELYTTGNVFVESGSTAFAGTYYFYDVPDGSYYVLVTDSNGDYFPTPTIFVSCAPPTTTTTTTAAPVYPLINLEFNISGQDSTIQFKLNGVTVTFVAKTTPTGTFEFQASDNGSTSAGSFLSKLNAYLVANSLTSLYTASLADPNNVVIQATTPNNNFYNFSPVVIDDTYNYYSTTNQNESGSATAGVNKTFFLPGTNTSVLESLTIPANNMTVVVDFFAGGAPDALEIVKNGATVATSNLYRYNNTGGTSNYGWPTKGTFRYGSQKVTTSFPTPASVSKIPEQRWHTDEFMIGSPIGTIIYTSGAILQSNRVAEFAADTGFNIPISNIPPYGIAQQRIWVKNVNMSDQIKINVTGAMPNASLPDPLVSIKAGVT